MEEPVLERVSGRAGYTRPWHDPRASPYEILGVEADASPATVRRAYLNLVRLWHPDRFRYDSSLQQEAHLATKCINEAFWSLKQRKRVRSKPFQRATSMSRHPTTTLDGESSAWVSAATDGRWAGRQSVLRAGLFALVTLVWLSMAAALLWGIVYWE
jgi:hypothetical protein